MVTSTQAISRSQAPTPYVPVRAFEDVWLREVLSRDPHLNVLVQCPDVSTLAALAELAELCVRMPFLCLLPGPLRLPEDNRHALLIGDISTLTLQQQLALYDWMERCHEDLSVISVSSVPVWPLVQSGRFLEGLYYRLNVLSVTASGKAEPEGKSTH
jgi:hypothetical protein